MAVRDKKMGGWEMNNLLVAMADKDLLFNVLFCYGVDLLLIVFKVYPFTVCPHHEPLYHITPSHKAPLRMQALATSLNRHDLSSLQWLDWTGPST